MRFRQTKDPFKYKQPEMTFARELSKPVHRDVPPRWNTAPLGDGEIDFSSVDPMFNFDDELLRTAYADFYNFMAVMQINVCKNGKKLITEKGNTECFEAYIIRVTDDECRVIAADTEGIRRALVYIEDEMLRREGARLLLGEIRRKPHITARVSRCYFTPASHAVIEETENELIDELDYYPDEYLNRLAHDGINALWLGASLRYLAKSDIVPEYGASSEKRMAKLNAVVAKCQRYGIKTYLFSVDPASVYHNDILKNNHPDMLGDEDDVEIEHICPSTEKGLAYIREAVGRVFENAPGLTGFINLSVGESQSHCASGNTLVCKRCKKRFGTLGKTLAFVEKTIADRMHEVSPDAEYVSWTYAQRAWAAEDVEDACLARDKSVRHLVNFEDLGFENQLGEERVAYDYWLSYVGPGKLFSDCLRHNRRVGIDTWAKIQVCSSHEISTVPYVPVPAILYDKYKFMYDNSIHGVMQCWFFGNYPCLMNKAAGELAFEPFFERKDEFLRHLAGIYWGKDAGAVADAWVSFGAAYRNYPIGVDFEWYGPMQDSPAAPYHLEPIDLPMSATWTLDDMVGSDRVCDAILDSHTLDEAITLCEMLSDGWRTGVERLRSIGDLSTEGRREQMTVAVAADYIFESGLNRLRFYNQRNKLAFCESGESM